MQTVSVAQSVCTQIMKMQHVAAAGLDVQLQFRKTGAAAGVIVIQIYQRGLRALPAIGQRLISTGSAFIEIVHVRPELFTGLVTQDTDAHPSGERPALSAPESVFAPPPNAA